MKLLHRPDLHGWTHFDEERNLDFHSVLWNRPEGNILFDPLPLGDHDREQLRELGGASLIVVTNSDHLRATQELRELCGARVAGPAAERESFPVACDHWLDDGDELVPGLTALALRGSKTPGELALLLEARTLIVGDLLRAHQAGRLHLLPEAKLTDVAAAQKSIRRLLELHQIDAVLTGDGWPVFRGAAQLLAELVDSFEPDSFEPDGGGR